MEPTAILDKLTITTNKMTTTTNNNLSVNITNTSVVTSASFFGALQHTVVGSSALVIRTIIPPIISVKPYREAIIFIIFFRCILSLSTSPSVSISDLTATVAVHFVLPTDSVERKEKPLMDSICDAFLILKTFRALDFLISPLNPR